MNKSEGTEANNIYSWYAWRLKPNFKYYEDFCEIHIAGLPLQNENLEAGVRPRETIQK